MKVALDGKILVPDLGWVLVAGKTREEAEALLTKRSLECYVESDIKVIVDP